MAKAKPEKDLLKRVELAVEDLRSVTVPNDRARKALQRAIAKLAVEMDGVAISHDPVLRPKAMFDPQDPRVGGKMVAVTLIAQPRVELGKGAASYGAGVYALYYVGDDPAYRALKGTEHPIYVGKADPKDRHAKTPPEQGTKLFERLKEHKKSIGHASNLRVEDFETRALVVATGWQASAEQHLINVFRPIWNKEVKICYGIGKHGDSAATRGNRRSPWDTMHPGRGWAAATAADQRSRAEIIAKIRAHFVACPPFKTNAEILVALLEDMRQERA